MSQKPTIGRIVIYRTDGRNGLVYDLPAIITCTEETHPGDYPPSEEHPEGRKNPLPKPEGTSVHLTVFTPGGFGTQLWADETMQLTPTSEQFPGAELMAPGSGTYVEWNVPEFVEVEGQEIGARSWRWPVISR